MPTVKKFGIKELFFHEWTFQGSDNIAEHSQQRQPKSKQNQNSSWNSFYHQPREKNEFQMSYLCMFFFKVLISA